MLFRIADAFQKREINRDLLVFFPVIVVTSGRAHVVYHSELDAFFQQHPDSSFLVPISKVGEYRNQIQSNTRSVTGTLDRSSQSLWSADFTVEQLAGNKQSIEVYASGDDDSINVGWYQATDKEIFPHYHKFYFGPGLGLMVLPIAVLMTALICTRGRTMLQKRFANKPEA